MRERNTRGTKGTNKTCPRLFLCFLCSLLCLLCSVPDPVGQTCLRSYSPGIAIGFRDRTMNTPASTKTTPPNWESDGCSPSKSHPASTATIGVTLLNIEVCDTPILLSA